MVRTACLERRILPLARLSPDSARLVTLQDQVCCGPKRTFSGAVSTTSTLGNLQEPGPCALQDLGPCSSRLGPVRAPHGRLHPRLHLGALGKDLVYLESNRLQGGGRGGPPLPRSPRGKGDTHW